MKAFVLRMFSLALLVGLLSAVTAAADPSGKWTWTQKGKEREVEFNLTLKADGEKLSGTLARGPNQRETEISEGSYQDGKIGFTVTSQRQGNTVTLKYSGKLDGDTIKGTVSGGRQGGRERAWEAKRKS